MPDRLGDASMRLTDAQQHDAHCVICDQICDQLKQALESLMQLIDDGLLVRNTTNDAHLPSYLAEARRLVTALGRAKAVLP